MKFTIKTSTSIPKNWDENLLKNLFSTGYQQSSWGTVYEKSFNSIPLFLEIKSDDIVVAQLLVLLHKDFSWDGKNFLVNTIANSLKIKNSLNWIYGPILFQSDHFEEILGIFLKELDDIAIKNDVNTIRGTIPPTFDGNIGNIFQKFNYNSTPWATHIIDLQQDEEKIYSKLDKKTRYDIRKSENNNLKFEIGINFNSILNFNNIKQNNNISKNSDIMTKNRWDYLYNTNNGKLFLAFSNGECISGISSLIFNKHIVQHGVGNAPTNLLGGTYLTWNLIKWGIKHGFHTLDLGGINPYPKNKKEEQISFYKTKWGGQNFHYNIYTKIFNKNKYRISNIIKNPSKLINFLKYN